MADVVHKTTLVPSYKVNTPDYPTATYLINPAGLPALDAAPYVPIKYRKLITSDTDVGEMTQTEKDAYDAANPVLVMPLDIPTLTTTQRDEHVSPPKDWLIYNSTTDQLERYNGTAWGTVGGGGDLPPLATASPSGAAQVDFEDADHFDGTYDQMWVEFWGLNSSTDNTSLILRAKIGGSYIATGYKYRGEAWTASVNELFFSSSATGVYVIDSASYKMGTGSGEKYNGKIEWADPASVVSWKGFRSSIWGASQAGGSSGINQRAGGGLANAGALQGIRLLASAGNLTGEIRLYGRKGV